MYDFPSKELNDNEIFVYLSLFNKQINSEEECAPCKNNNESKVYAHPWAHIQRKLSSIKCCV